MFLTSTCPIYNLGFVLLQLCEQCASLQSKVHILYCQHFYNNSFNYRQVSWRHWAVPWMITKLFLRNILCLQARGEWRQK